MASWHITRPSILNTSSVMYYVGDDRWSDDPADRKNFTTKTAATNLIAPTTRTIGGAEIPNANGGFKNATIVKVG